MMIDRAIEFATKAHEGQFRKGTKRPYIVHPIEVGGHRLYDDEGRGSDQCGDSSRYD